MPRAPRIPRAHVIALSRPDPVLSHWREEVVAGVAFALLLLALLGR